MTRLISQPHILYGNTIMSHENNSNVLKNLSTILEREGRALPESYDGFDFSGMNLTGLSAKHLVLKGSNLDGANLSNVDIEAAIFTGVYSRRNLSGANLKWVEFNDCDLEGADLTGANIEAELNCINFDKCVIVNTNFKFPNLKM